MPERNIRTVDSDMTRSAACGLVDSSLDRPVPRAASFDQTPNSIPALPCIKSNIMRGYRSDRRRATHEIRDEDLRAVLQGHVRMRHRSRECDQWRRVVKVKRVCGGGYNLAAARVVLHR